jgi:hypothetical protein
MFLVVAMSMMIIIHDDLMMMFYVHPVQFVSSLTFNNHQSITFRTYELLVPTIITPRLLITSYYYHEYNGT